MVGWLNPSPLPALVGNGGLPRKLNGQSHWLWMAIWPTKALVKPDRCAERFGPWPAHGLVDPGHYASGLGPASSIRQVFVQP